MEIRRKESLLSGCFGMRKSYLDTSAIIVWKNKILLSRFRYLIRLRWKFLFFLNLLFFGCLTVTVVFAGLEVQIPVSSGWRPSTIGNLSGAGWIGIVIGILAFDIIFGGFLVTSISGILFFPLPTGVLVYRAFGTGVILWALPNSVFWSTMFVFFLEGEAYVFSALASTLVGVSWIMPTWAYEGQNCSRMASFRKSLADSAYFYFVGIALLTIAALIEALIFF